MIAVVARELARRGDVRASDADRDRAVAALRHHFAAGRLSDQELEARVATACAAQWRSELRATLAGLPSDAPVRAARRLARTNAAALRAHVATFAVVNGASVGVWAAAGSDQFWPAFVLAPTAAM